MGLEIALGSALSGLKVNQENLSVISQNIANVNTENYSRRIVQQKSAEIAGVGQGVNITAITRRVEEFLTLSVRTQGSKSARTDVIDEYFSRIQLLFGKPDTPNNLNASLDTFFSALRALANNPELPSLRQDTVTKGVQLADKISTLAYDLQQLRYEADRGIKNSITVINNSIYDLRAVNVALDRAAYSGTDVASLMEERDNILQKMGEQLNVNVYFGDTGKATVTTASGKGLLDDNIYQINYTPATTVDTFIEDSNLDDADLNIVDPNTGEEIPIGAIFTGGTSSEVISYLTGGKIQGYLEIRDQEIPRILEQLDNLASVIRDQFNAIHNDGAGYPPANSLTGTTLVTTTDTHDFSGAVRIGLVDEQGRPLVRADGTKLNPLTLDLESLESGYGAGQPTIQDIIDEINQYFYYDPTLSTTSLGNLYDIKMVATSSTLGPAPNGTFSFDFELNNTHHLDATFEVQAVTVDNGATGLTTPLPANYTAEAGTRTRTGLPMTVDFAAGSGGPYTISVQLKVTDADGNISTGIVDFVVDDTPADNDVLNDRYVASSATGDATITAPGTTQRFAQATLVDDDGNVTSGTSGYLKFTGLDSTYRIVIDELDSTELGSTQNPTYPITNKGFSHFFGLNNFFVDNTASGSAANAINMRVRSDIIDDPNLISMGELTRSPDYIQSEIVGDAYATGTMQFNGIPSVGDTITINGVTFTYVAAAVLDSEITIGATLPITLTNTAAKLNAINATTSGAVDKATYASNGSDTINITATSPGTDGNYITLSASMGTVGISINGGTSATTVNGNLQGGTDKTVNITITPASYEIGPGANQVIDRLATLSTTIINFVSAGSLPASSNTLSGYAADIVSYSATKAKDAISNAQKEQLFLDGFTAKFKSVSGVNLDEELANTVIYQNAYTASARVITVTKELFDILFDTINP